MKIVMFCDFYGEALSYQENLVAKQYVENGHSVTVITSTFESIFEYVADNYDGNRPQKTVDAAGVKIIRLPYKINLLNRLRYFGSIDEALAHEAPDLIFVHDILPNLINAARYVRAHPRTQMIVDYHADYSNSGKNWLSRRVLHGILRRGVYLYARRYIRAFFPITPASAKFLHELYGVPYEDMELLPLGSDIPLARNIQRECDIAALRAQYGIEKTSFVLFTAGRLTPSKRTEVLIEAFKNAAIADAWLVIGGDTLPNEAVYKESLVTLAAQHPRIVFTGWLDTRQLFEHIAMSDVGVFPASQSVVWQHVIALGKPLIIAEPRAQKGGDTDFTYLNLYENVAITDQPLVSAKWLSETMTLLSNDEPLRLRMAEGARRVAAEQLDWTVTIKKTLQFNQ